jgi:DNA helicase-2/ATP-dependent DNA helicase PcrA
MAFAGGKMGVSAVPGSGKTRTLAELAAKLVKESLSEDQEVLVVTLVNSAVDSFKRSINQSIKGIGLLPNVGYRVRTLHALAHDIVRERPGLVGLSEDFGIIDEREADAIRDDVVDSWLRAHPDGADYYLAYDVEGSTAERVKRTDWPALVRNVATGFIKRAKDLQCTPEALQARLDQAETLGNERGTAMPLDSLRLARMGVGIYVDYQRSLAYRGAVDFDDLIRLALEALHRDADFLARLQRRWPHVLEDEAQDSSELQEKILRLLVGQDGNWVRVGDPNQAIYDTFTNANPRFLIDYLAESGVTSVKLQESGRSQPAIIELANRLVDWTVADHPTPSARCAFLSQDIQPTGRGDPQPNPPYDPAGVQLIDRELTPEQELQLVADSLKQWIPEHKELTVAVLTPRNQRGEDLVALLKQRDVPCFEMLRSTNSTRQTAGALGNVLHCLADPTSSRWLSTAFQVWRREDREEPAARTRMQDLARRIRGCPAVEAYLWPRADHDWLASVTPQPSGTEWDLLTGFRQQACRWHRAAVLPIDQLVLTLANDLFTEQSELALAHKLAVLLRGVAEAHPTYRLPELVEELGVIARNERRFIGFSRADTGFEPPKGMVTVATMHKAKGLEWDRVYLMSVNNYSFPSGQANDSYIAERWFVRSGLNLEAEALAQLAAMTNLPLSNTESMQDTVGLEPEGAATAQARLAYVRERLRLLYVGITRAKQDIIISWNTGSRRSEKLQLAVPFRALHDYWRDSIAEESGGDV